MDICVGVKKVQPRVSSLVSLKFKQNETESWRARQNKCHVKSTLTSKTANTIELV